MRTRTSLQKWVVCEIIRGRRLASHARRQTGMAGCSCAPPKAEHCAFIPDILQLNLCRYANIARLSPLSLPHPQQQRQQNLRILFLSNFRIIFTKMAYSKFAHWLLCFYQTVIYLSLSVAACNPGQFSSGGFCFPCHPSCDLCLDGSTTLCLKCRESGPYESFLTVTTCSSSCTAPLNANYSTHVCECTNSGFSLIAGTCTACPTNCHSCSSASVCTKCYPTFFLAVGANTCASTCPSGQYIDLVYDRSACNLCNTAVCTTCVNESTRCTSCTFGSADRYLFNFSCLYVCPDGYEGNSTTFMCDECTLGMYSFENQCYSYCPLHYYPNDDIRACVLPGGYPLTLTFELQGLSTFKFVIALDLGLNSTLLAQSNATWLSLISLSLISNTTSELVVNKGRRLAATQSKSLTISSIEVLNNSLVFYCSINETLLTGTSVFQVRFTDNLMSSKNVIYSISASTSSDSNPWVIGQYFDLNKKPIYLVGSIFALFALLLILMRVKYIHRILMEYFHCVQLIGLTFYAIYPHSLELLLYSFTLGFDFANFTFIYNVPAKLIEPCKDCASFTSYSFAIGDMNWLRIMGPTLFAAVAMLLFALVLYIFKCSRQYVPVCLSLIADLLAVKALHGWFASLVYSGLNLTYNYKDFDMFMFGTHLLSYLFLVPIVYWKAKVQEQNKFVSLSFVFLVAYVILITLLSLAPLLICSLLCVVASLQWGLHMGMNISDEDKPVIREVKIDHTQVRVVEFVKDNDVEVERVKVKQLQQKEQSCAYKYHIHLLRTLKPVTVLLVACIIMIDTQVISILIISVTFGVYLILFVVDAYLLYNENQKRSASIEPKPSAKNSNSLMNETKEDLRNQNDQKASNKLKNDKLRVTTVSYGDDDLEDDVVANKFGKIKRIPIVAQAYRNDNLHQSSQLFKNLQ